MKRLSRSPGFALVEAIIVVALFVMVSLAIMYLYDGYNSTFNSQQALINANSSARTALTAITNNALQASSILATTTVSGTVFASATTTLVLQLPAYDSSGNILAGKSDYAVFYSSGSKLYELVKADDSSSRLSYFKQLSDNLGSISFTYNNASITQASMVTADIITAKTVHGRTLQSHLTQQIYLRNN